MNVIFPINFKESKSWNRMSCGFHAHGPLFLSFSFLSFSVPSGFLSFLDWVVVKKMERGEIILRDYELGGKIVREDEGRDILSNSTRIFPIKNQKSLVRSFFKFSLNSWLRKKVTGCILGSSYVSYGWSIIWLLPWKSSFLQWRR